MPEMIVGGSVRLNFDTYGAATAPFVLLVPGAGAPAQWWPEQVCREIATAGRFVVRYSHRDTGFSTHFDAEYPIDELLCDMISLVEHFGSGQIHLVGHSMGGYLVQIAMCRFPGRFASATSISASPPVSPELARRLGVSSASDATWEILMRNQPQGDFVRDLPGWLTSWRFLNGSRSFDEQAAIAYTRHLYEGDPRNAQVAAHHIHAMSTLPHLDQSLIEVLCPFLVLHGTEDPLIPVNAGKASARLVQGSRLHQLVDAGHMFFNDESWHEITEQLLQHTNATG
ncbi:MAG: alpha/beta fold hydrolase [Betaproteobacteria bacterium]|nr:alpha/beta fold hydrolase [Betaproteobacteria bacterium]